MKLTERSCADFAAALAAKEPAPGGGGAAAYAGALGVAAGEMAANLTVGKQQYAAVDGEFRALLVKAEKLRRAFLALVDKDVAAFAPFSRAVALPQRTAEEKALRGTALDAALALACGPALETMEHCVEAAALLEACAVKGNRAALSDAGAGAALCRAAFSAAALNVRANTGAMSRKEQAADFAKRAGEIAARYEPLAERLSRYIEGALGRNPVRAGEAPAPHGPPVDGANAPPLLLAGAPVAASILERARAGARALRERGVVPALVLIRLGERPDDLAYARGIRKRAGEAGVAVREEALPENAATDAVLALIRRVNADPAVHGALVFRPLPPHIDDAAVCAALDPAKDLDGITPAAQAALYAGRTGPAAPEGQLRLQGDETGGGNAPGNHAREARAVPAGCAAPEGNNQPGSGKTPSLFAPCTAEAVIALLDHYGAEIAGRRAVVVGRSTVIGRPAAMLLLCRDATVTICHSKTRDLAARVREADMVIAAPGKRALLGADCFRAGQWVIDVGMHAREDGSLCGDVDFAAAREVRAITPVPGGAGAVTSALLVEHAVRAAGG